MSKLLVTILIIAGFILSFAIFNLPTYRSEAIIGLSIISIVLFFKYRSKIPRDFKAILILTAIAILFIYYLFSIKDEFSQGGMFYFYSLIFVTSLVFVLPIFGKKVLGTNLNITFPLALQQFFKGLFYSIGFIAFSLITGITIGIPALPASFAGKIIVVVILAPIVEELIFRWVLIKFEKNYIKSLIAIAIINGFIFALFHLYAYTNGIYTIASVSSVSAAFIGAALFGTSVALISQLGKDDEDLNIYTTIAMHMSFNAFILSKYFLTIA